METVSYTILGAGIIGSAIAYELTQRGIEEVFVLEKNETFPGENQSSRNSGVIHAGIYYPKSTEPLKAKLCVEGNKQLYEFCRKQDIQHRKTGKLVVATNIQEEEYLQGIERIAQENGVETKRKTQRELQREEPALKAISALYVPSSGIIEPTNYLRRLATLAQEQGTHYLQGTNIQRITPTQKGIEIETEKERFKTKTLINATGNNAIELAKQTNPHLDLETRIIKGETAIFTQRTGLEIGDKNIYPTPHGINTDGTKADLTYEEFIQQLRKGNISKTLGVHLTPTFNSPNSNEAGRQITIGPLMTPAKHKEDYNPTQPIQAFLERIQTYLPEIREEDIQKHQAGIQTRIKGNTDFYIHQDEQNQQYIHLLGIDSPGLTASLAIATYVCDTLRIKP